MRLKITKPQEMIGLIQGQNPASKNEWYVALALEKMGLDYTYQYPLGDSMLRGGQRIDFVVWTALGGIPVYVQGDWWHDLRHDPEGQLKQAAAQQHFRNEPVLLSGDETNSREHALAAVREKVLV